MAQMADGTSRGTPSLCTLAAGSLEIVRAAIAGWAAQASREQ